MKKSEYELLEEAYLSVSKKTQTPEPRTEEVTTDPNPVVDVGPMDEPAPGVGVSVMDPSAPAPNELDKDTTGTPVSMTAAPEVDLGQEQEEDQMTIDNLNSVRESVIKVAAFCASGGHLEIWAQQKLAIAMDNLAEVARRLH